MLRFIVCLILLTLPFPILLWLLLLLLGPEFYVEMLDRDKHDPAAYLEEAVISQVAGWFIYPCFMSLASTIYTARRGVEPRWVYFLCAFLFTSLYTAASIAVQVRAVARHPNHREDQPIMLVVMGGVHAFLGSLFYLWFYFRGPKTAYLPGIVKILDRIVGFADHFAGFWPVRILAIVLLIASIRSLGGVGSMSWYFLRESAWKK